MGEIPLRIRHNPDIIAIYKSFWNFVAALRPGAYLADSLPWLNYLPWYGRNLRQGFVED